jgi:hypothetical protein
MAIKAAQKPEAYAVGEPSSRPNWTNPDCCPFEKVYHVAHVSDAYRIFEDRKIRSSLVSDESKLRTARASVVWLSPNTWIQGSFYGQIRFDFNWRELAEDKKFYWVEAMRYGRIAFRILVTRREPEFGIELDPYDPEEKTGPLWYDSKNDVWYFNSDYTGEFMLEEDLQLRNCDALGFESHHPTTCKRFGPACTERDESSNSAGARLLARLIGQDIFSASADLRRLFLNPGEKELHREAEAAWGWIVRAFVRLKTIGKLSSEDDAASPIMKAMLDSYSNSRDVKTLGSLFRSKAELELALRQRIAKSFSIPLKNVTDSED